MLQCWYKMCSKSSNFFLTEFGLLPQCMWLNFLSWFVTPEYRIRECFLLYNILLSCFCGNSYNILLLLQLSEVDEREFKDAIIWPKEVKCVTSCSFVDQFFSQNFYYGFKGWLHSGMLNLNCSPIRQIAGCYVNLEDIFLYPCYGYSFL